MSVGQIPLGQNHLGQNPIGQKPTQTKAQRCRIKAHTSFWACLLLTSAWYFLLAW